jgi:hypothetical protein
MSIKGKSVLLAGVLGSMLAMPALAQSHGGGGHAGGGGGGHAMGGGGHAAGGAHFSGGAHGVAGVHGYGGAGHYAGGYRGGAAPGFHAGYQGRAGYGYPGHYGGYGYGHGYSTGAYWGGGYWRGGYWPRAYYGLGFSWFLPVLPLAYATYWWSGVPYYYANDVYYTYDPNYQGYVATDPPPTADSSSSGAAPDASAQAAPPAGAQQMDSAQGAPQGGPNGPIDGAPPQIFMYPKNGQSADQQAKDKAECQQWATEQAGSVAQNGSNFNRAMVACVEGRGYSAR